MGIFRNTARGARRAVAYEEAKQNTHYVIRVFRGFFTFGDRGRRGATYKQFSDLPYSNKQIQATYDMAKKQCHLFLGFVGLSWLYVLYNLAHHNYIVALLSAIFSIACLAMAFRYHFWMMQITKRKLGCSFKEYWRFLLRKEARK